MVTNEMGRNALSKQHTRGKDSEKPAPKSYLPQDLHCLEFVPSHFEIRTAATSEITLPR